MNREGNTESRMTAPGSARCVQVWLVAGLRHSQTLNLPHSEASGLPKSGAARAWKARERCRIEAGLPPHRRHRTTSTERDINLENATLFFARHREANAVAALRDEGRTPQRLLDEWQRDCYRARTAHYAERNPELRHDVAGRLSAEERRMDDVAREINARLRTGKRRAIERRDAARPHAGPNSQTKGMGR